MTQTDDQDGYGEAVEDAVEDDVPEWVDQVVAGVAAEVRRRRKERGMTAQELADSCAEIGYPIPRNVIANMESGRRATLPLVEVMVLAAALNTHPILLIYPLGQTEEVQRLPLQNPTDTWDAMRWFTGEEPHGLAMDGEALSRFRDHNHHEAAAMAALYGIAENQWKAENAPDPTQRKQALQAESWHAQRLKPAVKGIRNARARIRAYGRTPPSLMPDLERLVSPTVPDGKDSI
jgi:transcriptional regulator with XRE-family HTH domain